MADPPQKAVQARALASQAAALPIAGTAPAASGPVPGRPARPELIHPARVPRRSPSRPEGLAALLHAVAHIEFNAINLALDAVWRFDGMPPQFYRDWARVAGEEALHFTLLTDHLRSLGFEYGDFAAHDGLWSMCEKTRDDVVARMALVPRTLEARGLDATPQIQQKLLQVKTPAALRAVEILEVILRDEVGHVAMGDRWYKWSCERRGLDPVVLYPQLLERLGAPRPHPPFNAGARLQAGFSAEEMRSLAAASGEEH